MSDAAADTTAILVLGAHRSGTSSLTRTLALVGGDLPATLLSANEGNIAGYWESGRIVAFNDSLLKEAGQTWMDIRPLSLAPSAARIAYAQALIDEEFGEARRPILKDPRLCRLAGLWRTALERRGSRVVVLAPTRNPLEVAASLRRRNGLPLEWGLRLWLRYVLDAEAATRGAPRCFLRYEDFLKNWRAGLRRVAETLDLDWIDTAGTAADAVDSFLDPSLRHETAQSVADEITLPADVSAAFDLVKRWIGSGESAADHGTLDEIRARFDRGAPESQEGLRALRATSPTQQDGKVSTRQLIEGVSTRLDAMVQAVAETTARGAVLEEAAVDAATRLSRMERGMAETATAQAGRLDVMAQAVAEITVRGAALEEAAADAATRLGRMERGVAEAAAALAGQLDAMAQAVAEATARGAVLEGAVADAATRLDRMERGIADAAEAAEQRAGRLAGTLSRANRALVELEKAQAERMTPLETLLERIHAQSKATVRTLRELAERLEAGHRPARVEGRIAGLIRRLRAESGLRAEMRLVSASGLFDAAWYLRQNPDVARNGMPPVRHFVLFGGAEGRAPGPDFDVAWYLATYPDVARSGMNPLVHYLKFGQGEGRRPSPDRDAALTAPGPSPKSRGPAARPPTAQKIKQRSRNFEPPDPAAVVFGAPVARPVAFAWAPESAGPLTTTPGGDDMLAPLRRLLGPDDPDLPEAPVLPTGSGFRVGDLWMPRGAVLRLRLDAREEVPPHDCVLHVHGLDAAAGRAFPLGAWPVSSVEDGAFLDIRLRDAFSPLVFVLTAPDGQRLSMAFLAFPSLVRGGAHYGELCALAPDLPYPAALERESRRFATRLWGGDRGAPLLHREIRVDLLEATGAEPIFSPDARRWVTGLLGCAIAAEKAPGMAGVAPAWPAGADSADGAGEITGRRGGGAALLLPADALPTLSALSAPAPATDPDPAAGLVLVRDDGGFMRVDVADPPPTLLDLQPRHSGLVIPIGLADPERPSAPLAIRTAVQQRTDRATILFPVAPDVPGPLLRATPSAPAPVTVVLAATAGPDRTVRAIEALRRQRGVGPLEVIVLRDRTAPGGSEGLAENLAQLFPDAWRIVAPDSPALAAAAAVAGSANPAVLLFSDTVLLHDARTMATLTALAEAGRVASASCALVCEGIGTAPGGVARLLPLGGAGACLVDAVELGPATVPVSGTDARLALIPVEAFRAAGGFHDGHAGLREAVAAYCGRATALGFVHVATGAITAALLERGDVVEGPLPPPGGTMIGRLVV